MEPDEQIRAADRVRGDVRRQSRWYPAWVVVYGLGSVVLVTSVPVLRGYWGPLFAVLLMGWLFGLRAWRSRQLVQPVSERRALVRWMLPWMVLYILVVAWIGPVWLGDRVGWWAAAGVLVSLPAFVEAVLAWRRLSR